MKIKINLILDTMNNKRFTRLFIKIKKKGSKVMIRLLIIINLINDLF